MKQTKISKTKKYFFVSKKFFYNQEKDGFHQACYHQWI